MTVTKIKIITAIMKIIIIIIIIIIIMIIRMIMRIKIDNCIKYKNIKME